MGICQPGFHYAKVLLLFYFLSNWNSGARCQIKIAAKRHFLKSYQTMLNSCSDFRFFYCASNSERVLPFPSNQCFSISVTSDTKDRFLSYQCFSISVMIETKDRFCFGFTVVETQIQKVYALNEVSSIHRFQGKVLPGENFLDPKD